jgi:hypothetical protein
MTRITHVRCDRCGTDVAYDSHSAARRDRYWVSCHVELDSMDFCPKCWKEMLKLADVAVPHDASE